MSAFCLACLLHPGSMEDALVARDHCTCPCHVQGNKEEAP